MRKKVEEFNKFEWHDWFAWYPVNINTGAHKSTWVWFERVQRKYRTSYGGVDCYIRNLDGTPLE